MPTPPRIFVSHSHHDNEWCRQFVGALQAAGWDVWYDEKGLAGGANWVKTIQFELQARDLFLLVVSPDSWASDWVQDEVNLALVTRRAILPVLYKDTKLDGFILTRQYVDVRSMTGLSAAAKVDAELRSQYPAPTQPEATVAAAPATIATPQTTPTPTARPPVVSQPSRQPASSPSPAILPARMAQLGFTAHRDRNGVEYILPPLCRVPAGDFLMGSDPRLDRQARSDEQPQQRISLGAYQIAAHPVTNAEYTCYLRAKGVRPAASDKLDHPVVNVSWYDAFDYAEWLAYSSSQSWRLPTEAEWEKAARGTDERIYPWGDTFDPNRCNTAHEHLKPRIGGTTAVGSYPKDVNDRASDGRSPYGAYDMAGNVWEWTSRLYTEDYLQNRLPIGRDSIGDRALRGGSWSGSPQVSRSACRSGDDPDYIYGHTGFRLVLASPGS